MADIELASRLAGGMLGLLVGDALGVPYEFRPPGAIRTVEFRGHGSHGQPAGTWSDDGALALALADSLLPATRTADPRAAQFDPDDQGRRIVAWWRDSAYTPDGDRPFDVGGTTLAAIRTLEAGRPAFDAGPADERACGNGSLMRILPLALAERGLDDATAVEHAHLASRVTHGHPRCQVACALYVLVARRLLRGDEPGPALASARATLRSRYVGDPTGTARRTALDELEAWAPRSGRGFVLDSFWSAWDAFAGAPDFASAVERAIHFGNDTDTTAAIAGGLAGIRWGWDGIPLAWRRGMRGHATSQPIVDRLVATTGARTSSGSPLRVDRIDLAGIDGLAGGSMGITFLPGKKREGHTGLHWRDLELDVARLRALGVDVLFLLVEDEELAWCRVPELPELIPGAGVELVRFPIRDPRVPTDDAAFRTAVEDLVARLRAGASVAIACRGGIDRSGMAAACILVSAGLDLGDAIDRVHAARRGSLTYPEQLAYVQAWGR
jgi:ADP-ribosylglycohydrolase/protein-tyrosine phosphatase